MVPAIRVENLSKQFRLGIRSRRDYRTLRESLQGLMMSPWRRLRDWPRPKPRGAGPEGLFWALRDLSFEVGSGEVVGLIGRNGAGKSTLLKILSRIVQPTSGRAQLRGRIGSLLEVGTGFHPELTGRENIYMNGSILGMSRREINQSFDEIVSFSEIEQFLDTPVKRYSSGMYVRLAFAVAAHLNPEILIIDEVLAVGDQAFQEKCLGKMKNVSRCGRTVLFVSHNMVAIRALCSRVLVMNQGRIVEDSLPDNAIRQYLQVDSDLAAEWVDSPLRIISDAGARLKGVRVTDLSGRISSRLDPQAGFLVEIDFDLTQSLSCQTAFRLNTQDGDTILTTADTDMDLVFGRHRPPGSYRARVCIPGHFLAPGRYHLLVAINQTGVGSIDVLEKVLDFQIDMAGSLKQIEGRRGYVLPKWQWETRDRNAGPLT